MNKTNKAITLIELLIASSIFMIVMMSVYLTFRTGLFGYRDIEENIDIYQTARLALERLNLDLRNVFKYSQDETKFSGNNSEILFLTLVDKFSKSQLMRHYAFVSYKLEAKILLRLCRLDKEALNEKSELEPQELASNIENFSLSYGFIESGNEEIKWKDTWEDKKAFPVAVKVKLSMAGKTKQEFERTIYFP